jgi:hypothetical protein
MSQRVHELRAMLNKIMIMVIRAFTAQQVFVFGNSIIGGNQIEELAVIG